MTAPKPASFSAKHSAIARLFSELPVKKAIDVMGMKYRHIAIFMAIAILVALLDGILLAMLIPVSVGLFKGSFMFMSGWPGIRWLYQGWPALVESYTFMFLFLASLAFLVALARGAGQYAQAVCIEYFFGHYSTRLTRFLFQRFLAFGKAYRDLGPEEYAIATSIARERHFALNWLCGHAPGNRWDETPTDT